MDKGTTERPRPRREPLRVHLIRSEADRRLLCAREITDLALLTTTPEWATCATCRAIFYGDWGGRR